jgi:hypothetical protein
MADWREPTVASYLGRVSETLILQAIRQSAGG